MNNTEIEQIKLHGSIMALRDRIQSLQWELSNRVWNDSQSAGYYTRLTKAMTRAEQILREIRHTFKALQEMEPKHK